MSKVRHISSEQTPSPPERLPRLVVPPPAAVSLHGSPSRRHILSESYDFNRLSPQRPLSVRRTSEEVPAPTTLRVRYPSEQMSRSSQHGPLRPTSQPYHQLYEQSNTHVDTSADGWRPRTTNLPSVTSGVAVKDFYEENWTSGEEGDRKKHCHLKEYRQKRRERRGSLAPSSPELEEDGASPPSLLIFFCFARNQTLEEFCVPSTKLLPPPPPPPYVSQHTHHRRNNSASPSLQLLPRHDTSLSDLLLLLLNIFPPHLFDLQ
ncbi:unnamed protein product [Hydatigera taeniaeformis]|uniref:Uncharacterized protein n=1 Tax=Hydatigena taeniaeformis TaxID=6205 RepID=A0A0R3X1B5_HYDTA|nr:unnamed protein product [Hydatigera taeniaeformis]